MDSAIYGENIDAFAMNDGRLDDLLDMVRQLASADPDDREAETDEVVNCWHEMRRVDETTRAFFSYQGMGWKVRPSTGPAHDAARNVAAEMGIPYCEGDQTFEVDHHQIVEFFQRVSAAWTALDAR